MDGIVSKVLKDFLLVYCNLGLTFLAVGVSHHNIVLLRSGITQAECFRPESFFICCNFLFFFSFFFSFYSYDFFFSPSYETLMLYPSSCSSSLNLSAGEKSYLCDMCGFAGGTRHALTKHRRQHTGEQRHAYPDANLSNHTH